MGPWAPSFLDAHGSAIDVTRYGLPWWFGQYANHRPEFCFISVTACAWYGSFLTTAALSCRPTIPAVETMATWPGPMS